MKWSVRPIAPTVGRAVGRVGRAHAGGSTTPKRLVARTPVTGHQAPDGHSYSVPPLRVRYAGLTDLAIARPPSTGL